jgi:hypothetical protein
VPKIRQLLNAVDVEVAQRRRLCHHNRKKHEILKGERCLVIKSPDGGRKNYCVACATEILDRAAEDLQVLHDELVDT